MDWDKAIENELRQIRRSIDETKRIDEVRSELTGRIDETSKRIEGVNTRINGVSDSINDLRSEVFQIRGDLNKALSEKEVVVDLVKRVGRLESLAA